MTAGTAVHYMELHNDVVLSLQFTTGDIFSTAASVADDVSVITVALFVIRQEYRTCLLDRSANGYPQTVPNRAIMYC